MFILILFLWACRSEGEPIRAYSLEDWVVPVHYGIIPYLNGNKFYIFDKPEVRIKVYDVSAGFKNPKFLWQTPGKGEGPGELRNHFLVNMCVDPESQNLWISHQHGFQVFTPEGKFIKEIKQPFNGAFLILVNQQVVLTATDSVLNHQTALRSYEKVSLFEGTTKQAQWELDSIQDLPVLASGAYLNPTPELHHFDGTLFRYDASIGQLMRIKPEGVILSVDEIKQTDKPELAPVAFEPFKATKDGFSLSSFQDPFSGMVQESEDVFWLVVRRFHPAKNQRQRVLATFSLTEKRVTGRFHIPGIDPTQRIYLFGKAGQDLLIFNTEDGDAIYSVSPGKIKPL